MKPIYLDYAAGTPLDPAVNDAMQPYTNEKFYNPSALYSGARIVKNDLENARQSVARSIGAKPSEITFTAGGTESANLAIHGVMKQYPDGEVIISAIEHEAVREPAKEYVNIELPVTEQGLTKVDVLKELITDKTVLISVMYANNEVGSVQPIKDIVSVVESIRKARKKAGNKRPLYVHTDACQAPQYLDCNVARLGVDMMTLNGGKLYGPKQSGVLYHKSSVLLVPQIKGGGQETGLRSGTENVGACVGFSKALELSIKRQKTTLKQVSEISAYFIKELNKQFEVELNGHKKMRLPNNIHVTFPGVDNERLLFSLDYQGVYAAAGSACSASNEEVSHVLLAMGLSAKQARSSVRFSIGKETTIEQIDRTLEALKIALVA